MVDVQVVYRIHGYANAKSGNFPVYDFYVESGQWAIDSDLLFHIYNQSTLQNRSSFCMCPIHRCLQSTRTSVVNFIPIYFICYICANGLSDENTKVEIKNDLENIPHILKRPYVIVL